MLFFYNLFLFLSVLIGFPIIVLLVGFTPKYRINLLERLTIYPKEKIKKIYSARIRHPKLVWIHSVSVGETMVAITLAKELKKRIPLLPILISTVTVTGNNVAKRYSPAIFEEVVYFPLDLFWTVKRAIRLFSPQLVILIETELWPNFLYQVYKKNIPVVLVNGRISPNSYKRYLLIKPIMRRILKYINLFLMQSQQDASRIASLGAEKHKIMTLGNLKFDLDIRTQSDSIQKNSSNFKKWLEANFTSPVLVAVSTHAPEEEIILQIYQKAKLRIPHLKLVLAPRHPERIKEIAQIVKRCNLKLQLRSELTVDKENEFFIKDWQLEKPILIIDTIGELFYVYQIADLVFVGGSLVKVGGHNILEPASVGKPVLFGPHIYSFREAADLLIKSGGAIMANNKEELLNIIVSLLLEPEEIVKRGKAAKETVLTYRGITEKAVDILQEFLT